jgi:hypothetical protein
LAAGRAVSGAEIAAPPLEPAKSTEGVGLRRRQLTTSSPKGTQEHTFTAVKEDNDPRIGLDTPHQMIYIHCDPSSTPYAFVVKFQEGGRFKQEKYPT